MDMRTHAESVPPQRPITRRIPPHGGTRFQQRPPRNTRLNIGLVKIDVCLCLCRAFTGAQVLKGLGAFAGWGRVQCGLGAMWDRGPVAKLPEGREALRGTDARSSWPPGASHQARENLHCIRRSQRQLLQIELKRLEL